jgi:hypothetical protein
MTGDSGDRYCDTRLINFAIITLKKKKLFRIMRLTYESNHEGVAIFGFV